MSPSEDEPVSGTFMDYLYLSNYKMVMNILCSVIKHYAWHMKLYVIVTHYKQGIRRESNQCLSRTDVS